MESAQPAPPAVNPRRPPRDPPRLSVVLVNYRNWPDTVRLVGRLLRSRCARGGAAEVVVVDNHSPGGRAAARLRRTPGVSLRRWGRNRGFARAVNEGCRLSRGDWLLLLNPDVTVPRRFLDEVLRRAERLAAEAPSAGVVGFRLRNGDGSRQLSAGPFPTLPGTALRLLLPRARRKYTDLPDDRRRPVPWVTGCCLLVRRDCFRQLGGLDPGFFLYYEDVDLCRRARAAGWSVWYEPTLSVVHHRPLHARRVPPHLRVITRHALLTYAARHWPRWQFRALAVVVAAEARLRRLSADGRGDRPAAAAFAALSAIVARLVAGRAAAAGRRLRRLIRREEERLDALPVGRRPQSQPPRPAAELPGERVPARPAGDRSAGR